MSRPASWPVLKTVLIAALAAASAIALHPAVADTIPQPHIANALLAVGATGVAGILAQILGLGRAWAILAVIATPCLVLVPIYRPPGWIFLAAFLVLAGFYVNGVREKVPLYLSNRRCRDAVASLFDGRDGQVFIDLGCGLGGVVASVAQRHPGARVIGVETAPLSFLIAWARIALSGRRNAEIRFQSIWATDVSGADLVYAFLSPAPMQRLNEKLSAEMKPGSLFVSNSFAVPGREPDDIVAVDDTRQTQLLLWRMPETEDRP